MRGCVNCCSSTSCVTAQAVHAGFKSQSGVHQALGPLNAVEHAALTAPLLAAALDALPRLKRDRKIFFVADWLGAFIGGQTDAASLDLVRQFAAREGLDTDLKLKVLESIDALERTVRIRARYAGDPRGGAAAKALSGR